MKKILTIFILLLTLTSCEDKGVTQQRLTGDESNLPDELKALKYIEYLVVSANM
jgi:hypothetical protein